MKHAGVIIMTAVNIESILNGSKVYILIQRF